MIVIIDKETNIVKYYGKSLTDNGVFWDNKHDPTTNKSNSYEVDIDFIPDDLIGGCYTWTESEGWLLTQNGVIKNEEIARNILAMRKSELAALRYRKETAGITVNGAIIRTDRESQAMISGAYNACQINADRTIDFKGVNGWVRLDATEITVIASAVADYVQKCFTREKELSMALDMDMDTDITKGWPE